jgi:hypothetical protein
MRTKAREVKPSIAIFERILKKMVQLIGEQFSLRVKRIG